MPQWLLARTLYISCSCLAHVCRVRGFSSYTRRICAHAWTFVSHRQLVCQLNHCGTASDAKSAMRRYSNLSDHAVE